MYAVILTHDFLFIFSVYRLFQKRIIVFRVNIDINGYDTQFEFFAFFQQCTVVKIKIFAVLVRSMAAGVTFAESVLLCAGNMLENKYFRRRFELAEFSKGNSGGDQQ